MFYSVLCEERCINLWCLTTPPPPPQPQSSLAHKLSILSTPVLFNLHTLTKNALLSFGHLNFFFFLTFRFLLLLEKKNLLGSIF